LAIRIFENTSGSIEAASLQGWLADLPASTIR
jgi:hypothetical protein